MTTQSNYVFLPSFSLQPNQVTSFNAIFVKNRTNETIETFQSVRARAKKAYKRITDNNDITRSSHNFSISDNAYRNLKQKINWLYYLSKSKSVKTYNGNSIFNFKIGFITLTLPSKQLTPTIEVTKNLLNPFLTEIRQRTKMENYVWRLEFQKNGNVHYHLVTDTYIDYFLVKKIWNRLLKSNGYIQEYQTKMKKLSLADYNNLYNSDNKKDFKQIKLTYLRNKSENWENPNSVDVKSVVSNKAIANYISKYFAKDSKNLTIKNDLDNDENSENMRLWFCSRSLSKLKTITDFCEAVKYDIFAIVSYAKEKRTIHLKYASTTFFEIKSMLGTARQWIERILKSYAYQLGYIPSS